MDKHISSLLSFLDSSPCNFLAVDSVRNILTNNGFSERSLNSKFNLKQRAKVFFTKNDSAIFAISLGKKSIAETGFKIIAAHSDSPCFRIKPNAVIKAENGIIKLNTEVYGGPILYTWFDRPLSLAGRVIVRSGDSLPPTTKLVKFDNPLLQIPHPAIHYNRAVNEGNPLSKQKDMLPIIAKINDSLQADNLILQLISDKLGIAQSDIIDFDLMLYDTEHACTFGANNEFLSSGRLDDLSMVHAAITAITEQDGGDQTLVVAIFDNEETGSGTKQGAGSPVLSNILLRLVEMQGGSFEDFAIAIEKSFMVSADNAHAFHPNYAEKYDPTNHPTLGGGPCIKINSNCKYMTDAHSAAIFKCLCEDANAPFQYFVNHSDVAGGSTLGNILTGQIDIEGVDVGNPLLAMHSVRETGSVDDHLNMIKVFKKFFE